MQVEREYPYQPKWVVIILSGLFFAACGVVIGIEASGNERGLVINGVIELGPDAATKFYWVLCACSVAFVVLSVFLAFHRIAFRQRLAFGPTSLIVPASRWSHAETEIPYHDMQRLSAARVSGQRFLYIQHPGGKYTITSSMLPSKNAFDEVRRLRSAKSDVAR